MRSLLSSASSPTVGWQLIVQTLLRVPGLIIPSLQSTYKLTTSMD